MENLQFVLLFSDDGLHFNDEDDYEKVDMFPNLSFLYVHSPIYGRTRTVLPRGW